MDDKKGEIETSNLDVVKRALGRLVKTEDGKVFINYLMKECGFTLPSIVMNVNTCEINSKATIYNEARKTIYYKIRELIKQEDLIKIENLKIKEEIDNV